MRISFTARHFKPTNRLKEYAEKKVKRLSRYYDGIIDCEIILDFEKQTQLAEIGVTVYGQKLVAIEKSEDIFKSIDFAVDKLERQVKKYKGKMRNHSYEKFPSIEEEET